jgi:hypothetical protein
MLTSYDLIMKETTSKTSEPSCVNNLKDSVHTISLQSAVMSGIEMIMAYSKILFFSKEGMPALIFMNYTG